MNKNNQKLITPDMKIGTLLDTFPELESVLIEIAPTFKKLKNPILRKTVAKVATIDKAAGMANISTRDLINKLRTAVGQPTADKDFEQKDNTIPSPCAQLPDISSITNNGKHNSETHPPPAWFNDNQISQTIDADAILAAGEVPVSTIMKAAKTLSETGILKITVDFKPLPMIDMLEKQGYQTYCRQTTDNIYELLVATINKPQSKYKTNPAIAQVPQSDSGGAAEMGGHLKVDSHRMDTILSITIDLFKNTPLSELERRFKEELGGYITPSEFALSEQKLSERGISDDAFHDRIEEIISLFKRSLADSAFDTLPDWHPVRTFIRENVAIAGVANILTNTPFDPNSMSTPDGDMIKIRSEAYQKIHRIEQHYQRKEHLLFPYLEKKGFTKPTIVMWRIHDEIRADIKRCRKLFEDNKWADLAKIEPAMINDLLGMIFKEEHILLPTAMDMLANNEWTEIREGEDDIGYCLIDPPLSEPVAK